MTYKIYSIDNHHLILFTQVRYFHIAVSFVLKIIVIKSIQYVKFVLWNIIGTNKKQLQFIFEDPSQFTQAHICWFNQNVVTYLW